MIKKTKNKTTMIFFIVIVVFCLTGFAWHRYFWFDVQYDGYISEYCTQFDVQKNLVYAIVKAESNFKKDAVSQKGAVGLMQIMPSTATFVVGMLKKESFDLSDPKDNLQIGIRYLSYLQTKFHEQKEVVSAYNAGENKVREWIELGVEIPYKETKEYLKRVERNIKIFDKLYK